MSELYMLIGPAGCGKSTIAEMMRKIPDVEVVSSDQIRKELYGDESDQRHNATVFDVVHTLIARFLESDNLVVFDATNLNPSHREVAIDLARSKKCDAIIGVVYDGDAKTCIERNNARDRKVPEDVIVRMHQKLLDEPPTIEEGFDIICTFDFLADFLKQLNMRGK